MEYYFINDLNRIGKVENFVPYLYEVKKGWVVDHSNALMDRIIGYDGESIGNSSELFKVEEITEDEANKRIKELESI